MFFINNEISNKRFLNNYLKIFLVLFIFIFFSGCSSLNQKNNWSDSKDLISSWQTSRIQVGDIIIKNKTLNPLEWYGHSGVVVSRTSIADYPQPFMGYREQKYYYWLYEENRKIIVLRYPNFTEEFKDAFLKNVEATKNQEYWFTLNKRSTDTTYCSKYIWYLYWKTAQDLGYELNIDNNALFAVFPYDFLETDTLEQVLIKN
ncbi:MAG: hypothetical protein ACRC54_03400 [Fusobacteriaceae bacterium]